MKIILYWLCGLSQCDMNVAGATGVFIENRPCQRGCRKVVPVLIKPAHCASARPLSVFMKYFTLIVLLLTGVCIYAQPDTRQLTENIGPGADSPEYESTRGSRVSWARGKFIVKSNSRKIRNWEWFLYPSADLKFLEHMANNTSINMLQEWNVVSFKRLDQMIAFPQIFLSGEHFVDMHKDEEANLKEYLLRGGMLWIDDCVWAARYNYFYRSMRIKLRKLFPNIVFKSYRRNHPLLTCYFKFDEWLHLQGVNTGVTFAYLDNRLVAIMSGSDLHCGWVGAGWFKPYPRQRDLSFLLGINVYVYSMCN